MSAPQDLRGNQGRWCAFHRFLRRAACHAVSSGLGLTLKVRPVPRRSWLGLTPSVGGQGKWMGHPFTSGYPCLLEIIDFLSDQIPFRSGLINPLAQTNQR